MEAFKSPLRHVVTESQGRLVGEGDVTYKSLWNDAASPTFGPTACMLDPVGEREAQKSRQIDVRS